MLTITQNTPSNRVGIQIVFYYEKIYLISLLCCILYSLGMISSFRQNIIANQMCNKEALNKLLSRKNT